ncbi:hypothetical protein DY000_02059003 [Brassica cretica]|uniref:Uncharacterized protein n=1 Tax=Brassica cretica TaxID=69181 RepID=A0ABQ7AZU2_BRACR|nr:hypothetical protein DY000_02059003 [Brassica cretica]
MATRVLQTIFRLLPLAHLCNRSSAFNPPLIDYPRSRLAAPPPPSKFACSASGRPGTSAVVGS